MQRPPLLFFFFSIATALLLVRCANQVSPTGGPRDVTPPRVTLCEPPLFATRFTGNSVTVTFDEFITLKNPVTEVFISPPLKAPLDNRLRGKSLVIKLTGKLDSNTTYSITFGNAITDLTEGNVLKGFNYVFSTGDIVDTLSLQGTLVSAFDHKPQKDVFVELYLNNNDTLPFDSLPLKVAPYYVTKSDENGYFIFNNLRNRKYKLFALNDLSGDLIFNQPSEKIAFYDTLVEPVYFLFNRNDTIRKDTLHPGATKPVAASAKDAEVRRKTDSVHRADSVRQMRSKYPSFPLFLFEETDSIERIVKSTFTREAMVLFKFRFPVGDVKFIPLNFDSVVPWYLPEFSRLRDSVTLWITRPKTDSLLLKVVAGGRVIDTVHLEFQRKDISKRAIKKGMGEQLGISSSAKSSGLNQYKNKMLLSFSYPLALWNFSKVLLIEDKDTLHPRISFTDSIQRTAVVAHKWKEDKQYTLIFPDSIFYGITHISHDSIRLSFKTKAERDFGNLVLSMNMDKRPGQYIVQLMDEKETLVYEEKVVNASGKIRFDFLTPGKYKIKAIHDRNFNGHWDTGNYRKKIQPEEVIYLPKIIEIRSNWDVEEEWD